MAVKVCHYLVQIWRCYIHNFFIITIIFSLHYSLCYLAIQLWLFPFETTGIKDEIYYILNNNNFIFIVLMNKKKMLNKFLN